MKVKCFPGLRRNTKIYHIGNGFFYHINRRLAGGSKSLRCVLYRKLQCRGRATVSSSGLFRQTSSHNHRRNGDLAKVRELRRKILRRCRNGDPSRFSEICEEEGLWYPRSVREVNNHVTLRSAMRRSRLSQYPNIPNSLNELAEVLRDPEFKHITKTRDGKDKLFRGAVGATVSKTRCVIFMSKRLKHFLHRVKKIFADGTWSSRPSKPGSAQVFTISTIWKTRRGQQQANHILPLAVVLMQSRKSRAYKVLFETLQRMGLDPKSIHCDFERAQSNMWKEVFPNARVLGCLYHYTMRLRKKARNLKLHTMLRDDHRYDRIVRSCTAIPLLPPHLFKKGLKVLVNAAKKYGNFNDLKPFLKYVKDTWLSQSDVLSVYKSSDRTNNVSESWNRMLRLAVRVKRPNVWLFLDALVALEDATVQGLYSLVRGRSTHRLRKASAVRNDDRIKQLTRDLLDGRISMLNFLKRASRRMQNVWEPVYD